MNIVTITFGIKRKVRIGKKLENSFTFELYFFSLKNQGSLFNTKIALCDNCMTMHALKPFDDFMTKLV